MTTLRTIASIALGLVISTEISPALATSCNEAVAKCQIEGSGKEKIVERCRAAGASCQQTGVFVGPITGKRWNVRR